MAKQKPVQQHRKKIPWVRSTVYFIALIFLIAGGLIWILGDEHVIQGDWTSILPIIFTVLGVIFAICQWLFPFSPKDAPTPIESAPPPPIIAPAPPTFEKVTSQMLLKEAKAHYNAQRYDQAFSTYFKVLEIDRNCDEAYIGLAKIYLKSHSAEKAFTAFELAERLKGQYYERSTGYPSPSFDLEVDLIAKRLTGQYRERDATGPGSLIAKDLLLESAGNSNPGIKRKHKPNEDDFFIVQDMMKTGRPFGLFVVADGMGGHANGQDASRLAIQAIKNYMVPPLSEGKEMQDADFLKLLTDGVQQANQAVHKQNQEQRGDMGTTMTAALVIGSMAFVANVGDSRTYLYREPQGLVKVTKDHSVVASLVDAGVIRPDDIYTHPKRDQIYRSLGEKPVVEMDTFPVPLQPRDRLLLCSDGLWDMVRDPLIQKMMSIPMSSPSELVEVLIQAALDGGGEDNVSVIVVYVVETIETEEKTNGSSL